MPLHLRTIATEIFQRTLAAIEVEAVVRQSLQLSGDTLKAGVTEVALNNFARLFVVAIGKASLPMARAAVSVLGDCITAGIIATNELNGETPPHFQVFTGGHPLPNQGSIDGAENLLQFYYNSCL